MNTITYYDGLKRCSDCGAFASYVVDTKCGRFFACSLCVENWCEEEE